MSCRSCFLLLAASTLATLGCGDDNSRPARFDSGPGVDSGRGVDAGPNSDAGGDPDSGRLDCVDLDGDGFGKDCALGEDCDDDDNAVNPAATETCNGVDDDCDVMIDEELSAPSCALTEGVCAGAAAECGTDGWTACTTTEYGGSYEADESTCDGLDNDCDGSTDEGCACTPLLTQGCGSSVGACIEGTQTCLDTAMWGACEGDTGPMGELCDGVDNDCDDETDEPGDLSAPDCPLQTGVCAGSIRTCGGSGGWNACTGTASYGSDYEATEGTCDGLDNDCDGIKDEGCECSPGDTQPCGSDVGACAGGTQTCIDGAWGTCSGEVGPATETCDGLDNDCDGTPDDALRSPACALGVGVCAGSRQTCGGEGGWVPCAGTAGYGPRYELDESTCDGQDNDCDGAVDEGCACVVGASQECGSSAGICERGTQVCAASGWGDCTDAVEPSPEDCNGLDDDCNSSTDDNLTAPDCALVEGVCAGATRECGGPAGWLACAGTDSYGPFYVNDEAGDAEESLCDGLDNDCDGLIDELCASGPVVAVVEDAIQPSIYDQHVAFIGFVDGNWEVFLYDIRTDIITRLTDNAVDESLPRVYGNVVVFQRGEDAAARIVSIDVDASTETVLTTAQSEGPRVFREFVVWSDYRSGTDYDVYMHDLFASSESALIATSADEVDPDLRGTNLVYASDETGTFLVHTYDMVSDLDVAQPGAADQLTPAAGWVNYGWTDARNTSAPLSVLSNWDVFGADFGDPSTEIAMVVTGQSQILGGVDDQVFVWSDYRNGNWDVVVRSVGGSELFLTRSDASQSSPTIHGDAVVWHDNRLGSFDIYGARISPITTPEAGWARIGEILADPAAGADVNGDGTANTTQDEFIEIVNATTATLDLAGCTLSDAVRVRHTLAADASLPPGGALLVFGGGSPVGAFAGVKFYVADDGMLGLNNAGDTITLTCGAVVVDTHTYRSEAGHDESITRDPAYTGDFVRHPTATDATGDYSPGTLPTGYAY